MLVEAGPQHLEAGIVETGAALVVDLHPGLGQGGDDADLLGDLADLVERDAETGGDRLVEVAACVLERSARLHERTGRGEHGVAAVGGAEEHLATDERPQPGVSVLEERRGEEADRQRGHRREVGGPLGAELLLSPAQQGVDDGGLRQRQQPADLEGGGERHVLAAVGHDEAQLVAGVGQRQPARLGVGLLAGRGMRRERAPVPGPHPVAAAGLVVEADVSGLGQLRLGSGARRRSRLLGRPGLLGRGQRRLVAVEGAEQAHVDVLHQLLERGVARDGERPVGEHREPVGGLDGEVLDRDLPAAGHGLAHHRRGVVRRDRDRGRVDRGRTLGPRLPRQEGRARRVGNGSDVGDLLQRSGRPGRATVRRRRTAGPPRRRPWRSDPGR